MDCCHPLPSSPLKGEGRYKDGLLLGGSIAGFGAGVKVSAFFYLFA